MNQSNKSSLVNILAEEDEWASRQPRAPHWEHYTRFMYVRHPHLCPGPHVVLRAGREIDVNAQFGSIFEGFITELESQLAEKVARAMLNLSSNQGKQLAALLGDSLEDLERHHLDTQNRKLVSTQLEKLHGRRNKLDKKITRLREALEDLKKCGEEMGDTLGHSYSRIVVPTCIEVLDYHSAQQPAESDDRECLLRELNGSRGTPVTFHMVRLFWFFHYGCDIQDKAEAEIRVALLRNVFWTQWEDKVPFYEQYLAGDPQRGCAAVRKAVERFR